MMVGVITMGTELLDCKYDMIGLSADWCYRTWLINGDLQSGLVVFENEDSHCYEIIDFFYVEEERIENTLFSGGFSAVLKELVLMQHF